MRTRIFLLIVIVAGCCVQAHGETANDRVTERIITDLVGRKVAIPDRVNRIGCLTGASYEKAFLVGAGDKVVLRAATYPPWMERTNPRVRAIPTILNSHDPNMEALFKQKIDVLFFWDHPILLDRLKDIGIPAVVPQPAARNFSSFREFTDRMKSEVRLYGRVFGGEAENRAHDWCTYYDQKVNYVLGRTSSIPEPAKARVYYLRGPDALTTHGRDQNITWYGMMAGAQMVVRNTSAKNISQVSMEDIILWNPEVIFVGRQYSPGLVLKNDKWKCVSAVQHKRVYVIPDGVFYWDSGSEGILLLEYMACKLYPKMFNDLNMQQEVREYYQKFYHCRLTDDEIDKLLHGLDPDGRRKNRMNN